MTLQPTASLGHFVHQWGRRKLPAEVADKAAVCLLDAIGLALIARHEKTSAAVRAVLPSATDPERTARVWADGSRVTAADAVLANAVAIHAQFHDDSDNASWSHPGSFVVSVALAGGELIDAPMNDVLSAVAIGYDATEWLGAKERVARGLIERGIRTSPTLGTIGASAAAAAILGLDEVQATNAIGIASSITGGVLEPVGSGSDEWRVQNGHAARGGLLAAQLAQKGVLGAPQGLEGAKGLARALAGLSETPAEWSAPPRIEAVLDICAKPWATLGDNMSVVIAAKLIRDTGVDHRRIAKITVKVWRHYAEYPGTAYCGPFVRVAQALASMTFSTAAILVHGALEYDIPLDHREDKDILRLVPLVEIVPDDGGGPYDADVEVVLVDGTKIARSARQAPRALLFHDRPTASELLERRLVAAGRPQGTGAGLASTVFDVIDGKQSITVRAFVASVIGQR
jgi:2-methylcitrate dehydratase PrpD